MSREELEEAIDEIFPFPGYRDHQREFIVETAVALWHEDYDYVIGDVPTGVGKSPSNYTLGRLSESAFYTTPQKSLRNQLQNDEDLEVGMKALRARQDYMCDATGFNCEECPINNDNEDSCFDESMCTYVNHKREAMNEKIAAITFAYLIVDNYLPAYMASGGGDPMNPMGGQEEQISFEDRELGIVDECHKLEQQVASLFAGWSVSPWKLPADVFQDTGDRIQDLERRKRDEDFIRAEAGMEILDDLVDRARRFVRMNQGVPEYEDDVEDCESFIQKFKYFKEEMAEGRDWVAEIKEVSDPEKRNGTTKSMKLKPIKIDKFLNRFIWSRSDKWVLTTATMPFREDPEEWCDRLGIPWERTKVIRKPMPFPVENRLVHNEFTIDKFSSGGDKENWGSIISALDSISDQHSGEKGLIHTASYQRAKEIHDDLPNKTVVHRREEEVDEAIHRWQESQKQMLLSPSMMEGVDLKHDMCRFQVLVKVPYPQVGDPRVSYLLNENGDWDWYYESTALGIAQSVGRAVRAADDYADYYVLDKSFDDVRSRTSFPDWLEDAIEHSGLAV